MIIGAEPGGALSSAPICSRAARASSIWPRSHRARPTTGREGVAQFLGTLLAHIETQLEVGELIESGDDIVQIGHTQGTVLATGKKFRAREIHIWRFTDGMVTHYQVHIDVPVMLEALA